jgi:BMFP domain-containing protein YqiC
MALEKMEVFEAVRKTVYPSETVDELFRRIRERMEALEARVKELEGKKE